MRHSQENKSVSIIGAGLAGSEASWQLAQRGVKVHLWEMRPVKNTEAHITDQCAELVCSNSFGSLNPSGASAILKNEILELGAFVLRNAFTHRVAAGQSLAVDRQTFSAAVTRELEAHPNIEIHREEVTAIPEGVVIIASGPLTTPALAKALQPFLGNDSLYFYDAISPIVSFESLDLSKMFFGSRYGKGDPDFLNVPLNKEQYETLVADLLSGDVVLPHDFEEEKYFESCMPIEALAARGPKTLAFGPLKPVGLHDPVTDKRAHAVLQLRRENRHGTSYNLVGFQTKLKYGEQQRIFRKLPGFENAEFLRLGSLHRNTFIDSPRVLSTSLQLKSENRIFMAGQLTGTEGYLESSATGLWAAMNALRLLEDKPALSLPDTTILGGLLAEITDSAKKNFQPINSNMGVLRPLEIPIRDKQVRNQALATRSMESIKAFVVENAEIFELSSEEKDLEENCRSLAEWTAKSQPTHLLSSAMN